MAWMSFYDLSIYVLMDFIVMFFFFGLCVRMGELSIHVRPRYRQMVAIKTINESIRVCLLYLSIFISLVLYLSYFQFWRIDFVIFLFFRKIELYSLLF